MTQLLDLQAHEARAIGNAVVSPRAYADNDDIHRVFAQLRASGTPQWLTPDDYRAFWAVTRHAQIKDASLRSDVFVSSRRSTLLNHAQEEAARRIGGRYGRTLRSLIHMDEPDHAAYRAVAQDWFTGVALRRLQPMLQALAEEFVAKLGDADGTIDFASEIAIWYPLRVIMGILGVPPDDLPMMHSLTKTLAAPQDPELALDATSGDRLFESIPVFTDYFLALMADRRRHPRDDLATVIANGQVHGGPMGELETVSYYITMAVAGHDTTATAMAGGMRALAERPAQWAMLREQPARVRVAVDEFIRWVTPIKHFMRTASRDTELGGRTIRAGESIAMFYLSGNRDEEVFGDPFEFRVDRMPNPHLAFGHGPHQCLGMVLSRMELTALYTELVRRVREVSLDGPVRPIEANFLSGFKSVPIRYRLG